MNRRHAWLAGAISAVAALLAACSDGSSESGRLTSAQQEAIAAARRAVEQQEDWADRAEYKIERHRPGWQVTAWKVVHPEARGNLRYVPWGRSTMVIDQRGQVAEYRRGK